MKALLLKDMLIVGRGTMGWTLLLILLLTLLPGLNLAAFGLIYAAMLPLTALSYDEFYRWDRLAAMMPFTPRQIVWGKYVFGYLTVGLVTLLSIVTLGVYGALNLVELPEHGVALMLFYGLLATLFVAVSLPMAFRLGRERAGLARIVCLMVIGALYGLLAAPLSTLLSAGEGSLSPAALAAMIVLGTVLANAVSVGLSLRWYRKKFR